MKYYRDIEMGAAAGHEDLRSEHEANVELTRSCGRGTRTDDLTIDQLAEMIRLELARKVS